MLIGFYSYKGGVGRTLALANVACLLAQDRGHPQSVLLWDFDVEAPGLKRLFPPPRPFKLGFVDLVHHFAATGEVLDVRDYIYKSSIPGIDVLSAGNVGDEYCQKLHSIDWQRLFTDPSDPGPFFSKLLAQIKDLDHDYVLIDSRTGLNDQAGICTQVLSDLVVIIFRLTGQNIEGVQHLVPSIRSELARRGRKSVQLIPIASEVPSNSSPGVQEHRDKVTELFETEQLQCIRFDYDLVADEPLFCLKDELDRRWPVPPIVDDYRVLCDYLRERNPDDTRTALHVLRGRIRVDDPTSASALLKKLLKRRPLVAQLWDDLEALSQRSPKQVPEFEKLVESILARYPSNSFAIEWRANRLLEQVGSSKDEKLARAKSELGEAIASCNRESEALRLHRRMADIASSIGDLDLAVESLRESMLYSPQNAKVTLDLANLYVRKGSAYFGSAIEVLRKFPPDASKDEHLILLTFLHSFLGERAAAQETFDRLCNETDDRSNLPLVDAHRHLAAGMVEEALRIAESSDWDREDTANRAELFLCAEEFDKAIAIANSTVPVEQTTFFEDDAEITMIDPREEDFRVVGIVARFIQGTYDGTIESILEVWRKRRFSWQFREMIFFRERVLRKEKNPYGDRLGIIEAIVREDSVFNLVRRGMPRSVFGRGLIGSGPTSKPSGGRRRSRGRIAEEPG